MTRTSSKVGRSLLVAFAFATASVPGVALAQQPSTGDIAQARELFNQAMDLRDKGDARGALEKFRAAHALAGTPVTGLELGRTSMSLGMLVEARETFLSVARIRVSGAETPRSTAAREEASTLAQQVRARIPSITVKISGVPVDAVSVTIDGAAVPTAALLAPRLVNPGAHTIVATSTTGGHAETKVDLKDGESREVELNIAFVAAPRAAQPAPPVVTTEPAVPAPVADAPRAGGRRTSPLVYVGFGVGAAGLIAGTVTGILAFSKASSVSSACSGTICPRSADDDLQSGRTMGNISTISFIVAGAGAAVGVAALLWLSPRAEPTRTATITPWIGLGSAGLRGSF